MARLHLRQLCKAWNNASLIEAMVNSLVIALLATILATLIGTLVALLMWRSDFPSRAP